MQPQIQRIKACLNGGRRREEHPAVPITPGELAAAAAGAVAAGAEALHLHPRDRDAAESLDPDDVAAAVTAVRRRCSGMPVGVSTGLWISDGDIGRRLAMVARWADLPSAARPDFASVNVSEPGFVDLVEALRRAGIAVEAGVWSTADAQALAAAGRSGWTRILVEIVDGAADTATAAADAILASLDELGVDGPRLLHGEEAACWPLVAHAGRLGLPTRIGLEDTVVGPAGAPILDNADLVRRALAVWTAAAPSRQ
ncbi:3-keto-5-aminohexanoate cleavage protein [Asanoa iriomotensis]|uniref:3-keto-5-aminohexanoate cleavage enzyme n=1 Tax=Asanoa iriomotensis TaxID=234613 RepID=A0ABQ4CEN0_9ACTN|nr:3-keto-5-aminohexanoate cleavage protein [Asanoa iriomotensis]GIF61215.1 3-keto-5-aminohexanoate cleavage enzyme [Asanoa iriomotensis]